MLKEMKRILALGLFLAGCTAYHAMKQVPLPEGAREFKDIAYYQGADPDPEKHRLDVYVPPGAGPHPVVVFFHGGAWKRGDRDTRLDLYEKLARKFMARGILMVVPSYRLAPEHKYPAFVVDAARAVKWVQDNIASYGGRTPGIFLMGHSAGAHISALLVANPVFLKEAGANASGIAGVVGISGPYDIVDTGGRLRGMTEDAFGPDPAVWKQATVMTHLGAAPPPPFLVVVAHRDPESLHRQADELIRAIRKSGGRVQRFEAKGRGHISEIVRLGDPGDPLGDAVERFIKQSSAGSSSRPESRQGF